LQRIVFQVLAHFKDFLYVFQTFINLFLCFQVLLFVFLNLINGLLGCHWALSFNNVMKIPNLCTIMSLSSIDRMRIRWLLVLL
jgi:hypothetical protein